MYEDDPRSGYPESGTVTIASGDGSDAQTVISLDPNELFVVTGLDVHYATGGTGDPSVNLYDSAQGTAAGDERFVVQDLTADEQRVHEEIHLRDIEGDVQAAGDGDQDSEIVVNVWGYTVTALKDMQGVA